MNALQLIFVMLAVLANLGAGLFVWSNNKKSATHVLFLLHTLIAAIWTVTNYYSLNQVTDEGTLFFARSEISIATLYSFTALFTLSIFPQAQLELRKHFWLLLIGVICLLVAGLAHTSLIFETVTGTGTNVTVVPGKLIPLYGIVNIGMLITLITLMVLRIRHSQKREERRQYQLLLTAVLLSNLVAFITNFVFVNLLGITSLLPIAPYLSLLFVGITGYAILAYHLFDIRLVISRAIIYSTILGITMAVYGGTLLLLSNLFDAGASRNLITSLITALFLGFSFEPIRTWISEKTDNWLYKKEYEQQEVTKLLSEKLSTALGLDEGLDVVMQTLADTLHLDKAVTYVFQNAEVGKRAVKRSRQIGYTDPRQLELSDKDFLVQFFTQHQDILSLEGLERQLTEEASMIAKDRKSKGSFRLSSDFLREHAVKQAILRKLKELDAAVAVPLHLQV